MPHLLLRAAQHAHGADVVRVLGQTALSSDPLGDGLGNVHRLQADQRTRDRRIQIKEQIKQIQKMRCSKIRTKWSRTCTGSGNTLSLVWSTGSGDADADDAVVTASPEAKLDVELDVAVETVLRVFLEAAAAFSDVLSTTTHSP